MASRSFKTTLCWSDEHCDVNEVSVVVSYDTYAGYRGDRIDPPEDSHVEITGIVPGIPGTSIPDRFMTDDDLLAECMEDWTNDEIAAAEYRAEQRRDYAMMDRLQ